MTPSIGVIDTGEFFIADHPKRVVYLDGIPTSAFPGCTQIKNSRKYVSARYIDETREKYKIRLDEYGKKCIVTLKRHIWRRLKL